MSAYSERLGELSEAEIQREHAELRGLAEHDRRRLENQRRVDRRDPFSAIDNVLVARDMERIFTEDWA